MHVLPSRVLGTLCALCLLGLNTHASGEERPLHFAHWGINHPIPEDAPSHGQSVHADPSTYPFTDGFEERRERVIRHLAQEDLARWRRGFFRGGDPGKYLPGAAMAKLLVDPEDAEAIRYMNDERSPREHYHFATVNWARFLPLFRNVLSEDTLREFKAGGSRYTDYISGGGTENHKTMQYTGPLVFPWYTDSGLANLNRDDTLAAGKQWIRDYVQNIYQVGMGEWESSTYHAFTINGFLNVYDFAKDPEVRLIAQAALDYFVGAYALKYTDGVLSGPSQRGFSRNSAQAITDTLGWIWWGSTINPEQVNMHNARYSSHTWTSRWRPNAVLSNIATRNLPSLPVEWRNSKSNYWFGQRIEPRGNHFHESFYVHAQYSLGSLWAGWDRHGQTVRWQLSAQGSSSTEGAITFTGGHPINGRTWDGLGRYEQTAQADSTLVLLTDIPDDDPHHHVLFHIPPKASWPEQHGNWWIMRANRTWVGVLPLGSPAQLGFSELSERDRNRGHHPTPALIIPGQRSGFVLQVSSMDEHEDRDAFLTALHESQVNYNHQGDGAQKVSLKTLKGRPLVATQQLGERHLAALIDGETVSFENWPVFGGPYFNLKEGILQAWDGERGYQVDFTGDLPVYSDWSPSAE